MLHNIFMSVRQIRLNFLIYENDQHMQGLSGHFCQICPIHTPLATHDVSSCTQSYPAALLSSLSPL